MIPLHRVASLVYNRPLLITPQAALTISSVLQAHIEARTAGFPVDAGEKDERSLRASSFAGEQLQGEDGRRTPFRVTANGTAIIPIVGELVNRGAWVGADSGLVSYEGIKHQLSTAVKDQRVRAILLDIESHGGEAVGAFDMAAAVRKADAVKPVTAIVNGLAASAAYAIASGARRRVTIPEGLSGSIGVVMMHLDISHALQNRGIKPTLIFAGGHKVDGNPFEPLPPEVRMHFQHEVEKFYDQFVATVAAGTGLSESAIRDTEAQMYVGEDASKAGLVDDIGTFDDVLAEIEKPTAPTVIFAPQPAAGGRNMSTNNLPADVTSGGAGPSELVVQLAEERRRNTEISAKLDAERQARIAAERERLKTDANAKVDAWERDGRLTGNATKEVRAFYAALASGETVTPEGFERVIAALPKFDTSRIAAAAQPQIPAPGVSRDDFAKAATNADVAKRIAAAVAHRQKDNPKFTIADLRREAEAAK